MKNAEGKMKDSMLINAQQFKKILVMSNLRKSMELKWDSQDSQTWGTLVS
jgi:hypothetical protein